MTVLAYFVIFRGLKILRMENNDAVLLFQKKNKKYDFVDF